MVQLAMELTDCSSRCHCWFLTDLLLVMKWSEMSLNKHFSHYFLTNKLKTLPSHNLRLQVAKKRPNFVSGLVILRLRTGCQTTRMLTCVWQNLKTTCASAIKVKFGGQFQDKYNPVIGRSGGYEGCVPPPWVNISSFSCFFKVTTQ